MREVGGTGTTGVLIMFNDYVNSINDMFLFLFSGNAVSRPITAVIPSFLFILLC